MTSSKVWRWVTLGALMTSCGWSAAFQIDPLGMRHEERRTNESNSTLADIAGKFGGLIKASGTFSQNLRPRLALLRRDGGSTSAAMADGPSYLLG